jgi:hypothetical protein
MNCATCKTEIKTRPVLFGNLGKMLIVVCECEATKLTLKYENTKSEEK